MDGHPAKKDNLSNVNELAPNGANSFFGILFRRMTSK